MNANATTTAATSEDFLALAKTCEAGDILWADDAPSDSVRAEVADILSARNLGVRMIDDGALCVEVRHGYTLPEWCQLAGCEVGSEARQNWAAGLDPDFVRADREVAS